MELAFLTFLYRGAFTFAFLSRLKSAVVVGHSEEEIILFVLHIMLYSHREHLCYNSFDYIVISIKKILGLNCVALTEGLKKRKLHC